jgi:CHAT domain-containing protein
MALPAGFASRFLRLGSAESRQESVEGNGDGSTFLSRQRPIEQTLSPGQTHSFKVLLESGKFVRMLVECREIGINVALYDPDGRVHSETSCYESTPISFSVIVNRSATYEVLVNANGKTTRSAYFKIRINETRPAIPSDETRLAAEGALAAANRLRSEQRSEASQAAIGRYKEAAELWQTVSELSSAASALRNAGELYQLFSDSDSALAYYQAAYSLSRKSNDPLEQARTLNDLGYLQFVLGNSSEALKHSSAALKLGRAIKNREIEAHAISNIGETYYNSGDLARALVYQEKALALWRQLDHQRGSAESLVALGYLYRNLSDSQKAADCYQTALSLSRSVGDLHGEAVALIAIANLDAKLGEKQQALDLYEQARQLVRQIGDRSSEASVLGGIGYIYYGLGDKHRALENYDQALSLFEATKDDWGVAESRMDVGRIYHYFGEEDKALASFHQALALFKQLSMPRLEAQTLRDIGLLYSFSGDQTRALSLYQQALQLTRLGQDQRDEAYTLNYIGHAYESSGAKALARRYYQRALPLSRAAADPSGESLTLYNLAHVAGNLGNLEDARRQIEAAVKISEGLRTKISSQDMRASYLATVRQHYELYIDVLMQLRKEHPAQAYDAAAFNVSEKAHARSLLESLQEARADIRQGVDAALLDRERTLLQALNAKAERQMQLLAARNEEQAKMVAKEIDLLTVQYEDLATQIRTTSPHYAALTQPQLLSLPEIQRLVVDDDSMLLEYSLGDDRSYLWAVTRNGVSSYELPGRGRIEEAARNLYALLTANQPLPGETFAQRQDRVARADAQLPLEIANLSNMLLAPISDRLSTKRLLIVPDGALQYIPFQILHAGNDARSLVADHEIVNEPSASTLALIVSETQTRQPPTRTVAVLADPVFEADDPRITSSAPPADAALTMQARDPELNRALRDVSFTGAENRIPRLPASQAEADAIMSVTPWRSGFQALSFAANRKMAMSGELAKYRIIHFATHGLLNNEHPELSGIVLSMFDEQGQPQDGYLRLHDIYNLKLPVDLVVLSACNTALGKDVKGEGLIGLTRGFMYAGAGSVVASLWKVDDEATAELMRLFYGYMLRDGLSPVAALRKAQVSMSQQKRWQAPYYWAGFVIQGQYLQTERAERFAMRRLGLWLLAGVGLTATAFFVFRRRRKIAA